VLLASLEPDEQRRWLGRAEEESLSVDDLRTELRAAEREAGRRRPAPVIQAALICPKCGHRLEVAAGRVE